MKHVLCRRLTGGQLCATGVCGAMLRMMVSQRDCRLVRTVCYGLSARLPENGKYRLDILLPWQLACNFCRH